MCRLAKYAHSSSGLRQKLLILLLVDGRGAAA